MYKKLVQNYFTLYRVLHLTFLLVVLVLGGMIAFLVFPSTHKTVSAESVNAQARVGARIAPVISLFLQSDSVNLDIVPTSQGTFSSNSLKLGVETNSEAGYKVMMSTASKTNAMTSTDTDNVGEKYEISSIITDTVGNDFTGNTWGYTVDTSVIDSSSVFKEIPLAAGAEIISTTVSTAGQRDIYNLGFGAHIDTSLPVGEYSNTVVVSVVANPRELTNLSQLTYMQDVTPEICAGTAVGTQRQLYDLRDGKKYFVERMTDGHCWMIQNLALDLEAGQTLTAADTDLADVGTRSWTVPEGASTETEIPAPSVINSGEMRSWNLGKILLTNPTSSQQCPSATPPQDGNEYPTGNGYSAFHGQNITETCPEYYKDVEGWTDGYVASNIKSYDEVTKSYDARYLVGNYYQWQAATAMGVTDDTRKVTDASGLVNIVGSICPKGWTLPKAGRDMSNGQSFDIDGAFYGLLSKYGYTNWLTDGSDGYLRISSGTDLTWSPLYFVRGGVIYPSSGSLRYAGYDGLYWSSTVSSTSSDMAYALLFNSTNIYPSYSTMPASGLAVRCVSK